MSIREISKRARQHENEIRLDIGQPSFDTPQHVKEKISEMKQRKQAYAPLEGLPELRKQISEEESSKKGIEVDSSNVLVTTGGMGGIFSVFAAHLGENDTVALNDPCWGPYKMMSKVNGNNIKQVKFWDSTGSLRTEARVVIENSDMVVVNTPQNPTGRVLKPRQAREIARVAEESETFLLSDEVYHRLVFDAEHVSPARYTDYSAIIGSVSKNHAMTGWRVGWVVDHEQRLEQYAKVSRATVGSTPTLSQQAAAEALKNDSHVEKMREEYRERRDLLVKLMREQGWDFRKPKGAIYAFPDVGEDSWDYCLDQVEDGVAMVPGESMGPNSETRVRICFGAVEKGELREAFNRL